MTNGYLLDSQVLVWLVEKPNRIGRRTWQILRFEELFYSTVSIAELGFKSRAARLNFSKFDVQQWQETGIQELSFGRSPAF
jgi:PIN domain nuclease of toxin-antitoxin system